MIVEKKIERIKPDPKKLKVGDNDWDVYEILKELNSKLETLEDLCIELKNKIQKIEAIQGGEDV